MTDSRLQQLRRAWEASGAVEDEAAYLRERVRVGELSQERLELAAYFGHLAARMQATVGDLSPTVLLASNAGISMTTPQE
ncbi:MAG: hypothetical protein KC492_36335, partial [Myxococcales bacterium]|nr:hypothetical protein [Myxococcales bacterium]